MVHTLDLPKPDKTLHMAHAQITPRQNARCNTCQPMLPLGQRMPTLWKHVSTHIHTASECETENHAMRDEKDPVHTTLQN